MIKNTLVVFGSIFVVGLISVLITFLTEWLKECIRKQRYKYLIKHRFDKPPTAKCYCKDCCKHGEGNACHKFDGWLTADNWFCWDAEPRGKEKNNVD